MPGHGNGRNEHVPSYEDDVFSEHNSFPRKQRAFSNYNTCESSQDETDNFRSRSLSLPYVSCNSRSYKRSWTMYDHESNDRQPTERNRTISSNNLETNGLLNDCTGDILDSKSEDDADEPPPSGCFCGFTKRQVKCGVALLVLSFTDVMGFSIFAPFFPIVAEQKNMSSIQIGVIFAAFSMAGIFASIITGTLLVRVGAKFIILSGVFWSAGATICFGLLIKAPEDYFFILCFSCRVMMGIGSSSAFTALFAVIFKEFSDRSLTMIGISESLCSIGGILGPLMGGALYDLGGYMLPFMFLGGSQFVVLLLCFLLIPTVAVEKQVNTVSPARLLLNVHGLFAALFVALSFMINSFIIANLSQFLTHSFHITAFMVGVFMLVFSLFYGISTPIWGYIAETRNCGALMMALSGFTGGILMFFFGPTDFFLHLFGWTGPKEWLVYLTTALLGTSMGALIMPTFGEMLVAAKQMKLHDNALAEYGLVSGLWNTVFSVGDILGPTLGGVLVEKYKFQNTAAIFGSCLVIVAILKIIHIIVLRCKRGRQETKDLSGDSCERGERDSLLGNGNTSIQA